VQLEHSFSVPIGIDEAWPILIDIERIGPCMPGAAIDSVDGDEFTGTVKVKLGPINLTYKGKASFVEKDPETRRAVIDAHGRDARGNGTASAKITATLHEEGTGTLVKVVTDLDITGKPAQFGRGVMVDVGNKLLGQFADTLAKTLKGPEASATVAAGEAAPADAAEVAAGAATEVAEAAPAKAPPAKAAPAKRTRAKAAETATAKPPAAAVEEPVSEPITEPIAETSTSAAGAEDGAEAAAAPVAEPADAGSGASAAAAATASVVGRAAVPDRDADADAAAEPAAPPASVRRSADDIEPIDLLQSAGPAVAKRLAPVAVALVVVLVAVRRYRHKG